MTLHQAVDKIFVWGHETFVPRTWCAEDPAHWTWKIVDVLWIDCACCFMFRAAMLGAFLASLVWAGALAFWFWVL